MFESIVKLLQESTGENCCCNNYAEVFERYQMLEVIVVEEEALRLEIYIELIFVSVLAINHKN